jgi:hypothetical protein
MHLVFRRSLSHQLLEGIGKIGDVLISHKIRHLIHLDLHILKKLHGLFDAVLCEIVVYTALGFRLKKSADMLKEIARAAGVDDLKA